MLINYHFIFCLVYNLIFVVNCQILCEDIIWTFLDSNNKLNTFEDSFIINFFWVSKSLGMLDTTTATFFPDLFFNSFYSFTIRIDYWINFRKHKHINDVGFSAKFMKISRLIMIVHQFNLHWHIFFIPPLSNGQ